MISEKEESVWERGSVQGEEEREMAVRQSCQSWGMEVKVWEEGEGDAEAVWPRVQERERSVEKQREGKIHWFATSLSLSLFRGYLTLKENESLY